MLKKTGLLSAVLILITVNLHAISFLVNNTLWETLSSSELSELSWKSTYIGKSVGTVSLDELFPAMFEAWRIEIETGDSPSSMRFSDPDLADELSKIKLIDIDNEWALLYKSRTITGIKSINIECEQLEDDPLEIWINWEGIDLLKNEINRWSLRHGIEVKVTEVPKPDSKLVSVTQAGGNVPDILMVQSSYIDRLANSSAIQSLDYMFPGGMVQQGREAFSHNGRVWAIPFYYDTQMLFFNPELIRKPDVNWSLRDFEETCRKAAESKLIPSAWNSYSASFLIPFQIAFGKKSLVEPDGSIIINDEPTLQALEYVLKLQKEGLMQPMERDAMTALFVSGEVASIISASYAIPHFLELGIPFDTAPLPINPDTGIRVSPLLDFKAFAISKRSKNTIGARRLIEYLCGQGVQQRFTSATAKLPALETALPAISEDNQWYETLLISSEAGTVIPTDKAYSIYKNTMWKMLRFAISGKMPAEQVLEKTQELVNKNLEDRN